MSELEMWRSASACYEMAREFADAARCASRAADHLRSARLYVRAQMHRPAAAAFAAAGHHVEAAWLLAHFAHDAPAARAALAGAGAASSLQYRLVEARCALLESRPTRPLLPLLAEVQESLAAQRLSDDRQIEDYAVEVAAAMKRFDQAALVFAASLRGGRPDAAHRWQSWAQQTLGVTITLPVGAGVA